MTLTIPASMSCRCVVASYRLTAKQKAVYDALYGPISKNVRLRILPHSTTTRRFSSTKERLVAENLSGIHYQSKRGFALSPYGPQNYKISRISPRGPAYRSVRPIGCCTTNRGDARKAGRRCARCSKRHSTAPICFVCFIHRRQTQNRLLGDRPQPSVRVNIGNRSKRVSIRRSRLFENKYAPKQRFSITTSSDLWLLLHGLQSGIGIRLRRHDHRSDLP